MDSESTFTVKRGKEAEINILEFRVTTGLLQHKYSTRYVFATYSTQKRGENVFEMSTNHIFSVLRTRR